MAVKKLRLLNSFIISRLLRVFVIGVRHIGVLLYISWIFFFNLSREFCQEGKWRLQRSFVNDIPDNNLLPGATRRDAIHHVTSVNTGIMLTIGAGQM